MFRRRGHDEPERVSIPRKLFSYFFPLRCSLVSEGSSRRNPPLSLAVPIYLGDLPSIADG